jgi:F-type H+-transporting ATPase subunit delta
MSLATSYAKALYQAAKEGGASGDDLEQIENQMDAFAQALRDRGIHNALLGPVVAAKDKVAVLEQLAQKVGFSKVFAHFLVLLANKGRLPIFLAVRDAFGAVRLESEGGVEGRLVSAEPVSDADVQGLAQAFSRKLGKKVAFRVSTDPELLAGMKVTVNGVTYDGSLRSQLSQLRERVFAASNV